MTPLIDSFAHWLADFYLLATVSLAIALLAGLRLKQPVQRLVVVKSTLVALFLLAALCAVPGWSLIHLMSHDPSGVGTTPESAANAVAVPDGTTPSTVPFHDQDVNPATVPAGRTSTVDTIVRIFNQWPDVALPAGVFLAHLSGAAFGLAWLTLRAFAAHRLRRSSQSVPAELQALMIEVSYLQNDAQHTTELRSSAHVDVAVALGVFRPVVLLPNNWLKSQSREELRTILAHECTHIRNGDLRWVAASRVLLLLLWAQPLYWLLRRRMRLDQEILADVAAADLTSRQRYAEQLVTFARNLPAPAMHLSAAVGLWEGPSQLRQRIALLLNERFVVFRTCSLKWRVLSLASCALITISLSFVTLQPGQSEAEDAETEDATSPLIEGTTTAVPDPLFIADRFILCRVRSDLQRSLLGNAAEPAAAASLCVFVNFAAFKDEPLDSRSPSFLALSEQLKRLAQHDNRYALMNVMVTDAAVGSDFEKVSERAQALAKRCEGLARTSGYRRAKWSTSYGGDDWKNLIEQASSAPKDTDANDESSVGDEQVQVFPVRTPLSRLLVKADCVVNITPIVRHQQGTRFPDDFIPALKKFVPQREYDRKQTLLIRVRYADSAQERLEDWVDDRAGRQEFARMFGFETANVQLSFTNEPERVDPVEISIIVAQHVMLQEGKIVEWADVERMITALPNPKLAFPSFMFTHGALPTREEEIRAKIWELRQRVQLSGHSWGSLSPRTSARYDAIRTAADLVPNEAWRIEGTVQTSDGLPIDAAEVMLLLPAPDSLPYKTLDLYLRNERLRNPDDEIVTGSDASGRFAVYPPPNSPYYLVALHREGFGLVRSDEFAKSRHVAIQPWAHVKGRVQSDERFEQSTVVRVTLPAADGWPELRFNQYSEDLGPLSPDGRFELAFVPPSLAGQLSRSVKGEQGSSFSLPVKEFRLSPGETLTADIEPPSDSDVKRIEELK